MKRAPLELDLIAPPRRSRWPGYVLLAVSIAAAVAMLQRYQHATLAMARLDAAAELVATMRAPTKARGKPLDEKSAQAALRQLDLPWAGLIEAVERAASRDVALLQLLPEAQQRVIRITAEARDREAMLKYVRALSRAKGLTNVHLVSEQVQLDDPQKPIGFSAQASFGAMR